LRLTSAFGILPAVDEQRPDPADEGASQSFADRETILANLSAARFDLSQMKVTYFVIKTGVPRITDNPRENHDLNSKLTEIARDVADKRKLIERLMEMLRWLDSEGPIPEPGREKLEVAT
jgi:hypothetical protein